MQLPDDDLRPETSRSSLSVLMCKFYIGSLVGLIIDKDKYSYLFHLQNCDIFVCLHCVTVGIRSETDQELWVRYAGYWTPYRKTNSNWEI